MVGAAALAVAMLAQPVAVGVPYAALHTNSNTVSQGPRVASALPSTGAPAQSQYFAPTGKSVAGDFLGTFQKFGLPIIGYPISGEVQENGTTVQYFERVRMERHPELAGQGYGVLFTRLGAQMTQGAQFAKVASFASTSTNAYIAETGHALAEPFLSYWKNNGGVNLFGYPISEAVTQDGLKVQWFERARFEYHPELASRGQTVELTLLGRMAYDSSSVKGTQVKADAAPATQVKLSNEESYLLKAINDQRAAAGLPAVQLNDAVTDLARSRSNDMAARNYFSHTTPEGTKFLDMMAPRGISYKFAGEILARNNYSPDQAASTAMDTYMNSAPHKAIIMDGRYNLVGLGFANSADGEMHYFTVIFVQQ